MLIAEKKVVYSPEVYTDLLSRERFDFPKNIIASILIFVYRSTFCAARNKEEANKTSSTTKKAHAPLILTILIFFVTSLLISYTLITLTTQRIYSIPSNEANYNSSTQGGDAFGDAGVGVFVGPRPGATNVSLDTVIYVDQLRPVNVDLNVNPEISIWQIKEKYYPVASRVTLICPAELLQPNTTYNVSGSIMGLSAWWTFTTATSVIPQPKYETVLSPYTWYAAIIAALIATSIFALVAQRLQHKIRK
jgi:uncharacterized integral membrane protein